MISEKRNSCQDIKCLAVSWLSLLGLYCRVVFVSYANKDKIVIYFFSPPLHWPMNKKLSPENKWIGFCIQLFSLNSAMCWFSCPVLFQNQLAQCEFIWLCADCLYAQECYDNVDEYGCQATVVTTLFWEWRKYCGKRCILSEYPSDTILWFFFLFFFFHTAFHMAEMQVKVGGISSLGMYCLYLM